MTLEWPTAGEVIQFSLFSLSSVFFTVDPIASLPVFLSILVTSIVQPTVRVPTGTKRYDGFRGNRD